MAVYRKCNWRYPKIRPICPISQNIWNMLEKGLTRRPWSVNRAIYWSTANIDSRKPLHPLFLFLNIWKMIDWWRKKSTNPVIWDWKCRLNNNLSLFSFDDKAEIEKDSFKIDLLKQTFDKFVCYCLSYVHNLT